MDEEKSAANLGWIGVGNMGCPMVRRLRQAGYMVNVCGSGRRDISPFCSETGACLKSCPRAVAEGAGVIFSMIPNGEILLQIIGGTDGLAKADLSGKAAGRYEHR
jgi:3-hydroxyisobutyrate dehydrogenase-like beta-hydroxyacid dehydrogenase